MPVAANLMRLADELLHGRGSKRGGKPARRVEHGVDRPPGEKRAAVGLEQACRLGVLSGGERPQRLLRLVAALEPPRGGDPDLAHLGGARGEPRKCELPHRRAERVPPGLGALELDEEAAARQRTQRLVGSFDPERVAEAGREALERRHPRDELRDPRMLAGEHLGGQVGEERPARPAHALERDGHVGGGHSPQGLHGEAHRRGPAAGEPVQLGGDGRVRAGELGEQRRDLVDVERELRSGDLHDPPLPSEPLDRKRKLGTRCDDEVQALRRLAAERLDRLVRACRRRDLVSVVDHENEVAAKLALEDLADQRSEAPAPAGVVLAAARAGPGRDRVRRVHRERRDAQPKGVGNAAREGGQRDVVGRDRVPGAVQVAGPGREERRLAETRPRDHARQSAAVDVVEDRPEAWAREKRRRGTRRAQLEGRGRACRWGRRSRASSSSGVHCDRQTIVPRPRWSRARARRSLSGGRW